MSGWGDNPALTRTPKLASHLTTLGRLPTLEICMGSARALACRGCRPRQPRGRACAPGNTRGGALRFRTRGACAPAAASGFGLNRTTILLSWTTILLSWTTILLSWTTILLSWMSILLRWMSILLRWTTIFLSWMTLLLERTIILLRRTTILLQPTTIRLRRTSILPGRTGHRRSRMGRRPLWMGIRCDLRRSWLDRMTLPLERIQNLLMKPSLLPRRISLRWPTWPRRPAAWREAIDATRPGRRRKSLPETSTQVFITRWQPSRLRNPALHAPVPPLRHNNNVSPLRTMHKIGTIIFLALVTLGLTWYSHLCVVHAMANEYRSVHVATIDPQDAGRVVRILERSGIQCLIEGSLVDSVSVAPSTQARAASLLRADSAAYKYWIQFP